MTNISEKIKQFLADPVAVGKALQGIITLATVAWEINNMRNNKSED